MDILRKIQGEYRRHFSTYFGVYALVFTVAITYIVISVKQPDESFWRNLLSNVGYSIIASVVFAILVDYGNTARESEKNAEIKAILTAEWRQEFLKLRTAVQDVVENRYGSSNEKYNFSQWLEKALSKEDEMSEEEYWNDVFEVVCHVTRIHTLSSILLDRTFAVIGYLNDAKELKAKVKTVEAVSSLIDRAFDDEDYKGLLHSIGEVLIPRFLKIVPEYTNYFYEPYNCSLEDD